MFLFNITQISNPIENLYWTIAVFMSSGFSLLLTSYVIAIVFDSVGHAIIASIFWNLIVASFAFILYDNCSNTYFRWFLCINAINSFRIGMLAIIFGNNTTDALGNSLTGSQFSTTIINISWSFILILASIISLLIKH